MSFAASARARALAGDAPHGAAPFPQMPLPPPFCGRFSPGQSDRKPLYEPVHQYLPMLRLLLLLHGASALLARVPPTRAVITPRMPRGFAASAPIDAEVPVKTTPPPRLWNVANVLTAGRLVAIPVFSALFCARGGSPTVQARRCVLRP